MNIELPSIDWSRIENFIGYGRLDAPVLFIGMEEELGSVEQVETELLARSQSHKTMDLLSTKGKDPITNKFFGPKAVSQRIWRPMCHLMLRRDGIAEPTKSECIGYQSELLGRSDGDTLLCEIMPYPIHDLKLWPYSDLTEYPARYAYDGKMRPKRLRLLRELIKHQQFELVICYGRDHWRHFEKLIEVDRWEQVYPFKIASTSGTRMVLCPHFNSSAFKTDQQLQSFADIAMGFNARAI